MPRLIFNILTTLLLCLCLSSDAFAIERFILSVENQRTDGSSLLFDISMFNISDEDIYLSESDFVLCFGHEFFFDNPGIRATHPDDDVMDWYDFDATVQQDSILFISVISPEVASQEDLKQRAYLIPAQTRKLVCSVTLSGISRADGESGLCWLNGDLFKSAISEYDPAPPFTIKFVELDAAFAPPAEFRFEGVNTSVTSEPDTSLPLRLYPQPAIDYIVIELPERSSTQALEVRDMRGALQSSELLEPSAAGEVRVDVSDLPAGVYQVLLNDPESGEAVLARSFVVLN